MPTKTLEMPADALSACLDCIRFATVYLPVREAPSHDCGTDGRDDRPGHGPDHARAAGAVFACVSDGLPVVRRTLTDF